MFPLNTWYVAATPDEIAAMPSGALGRKICGQDVVFFQDADGNVAALEDWCPHRGAPLSLGRVCEGKLVCGYHGLTMGADGKTVAMQNLPVRAFEPIRAYPVAERHGYVWIWPGDPALANVDDIPTPAWADNPEWAFGGGMFHVRCDYRLMIDNLMDLTHETYVHAGSIGQKEIDEAPSETLQEGDHVITRRFMNHIPAPPFWQMALRLNGLPHDKPVDRWQICHFTPPSQVMIEVGVALAGHGGHEAPAAVKASGVVVDYITPETDTSIWYFWGMARHFKPHDNSLTNQIREGQQRIFSEDMAMLERQQANHLMQPRRKLVNMKIDAGGVYARRILDRIVGAERGNSSSDMLSA
jgi:vanillate O-demethylase monooxygenase subunit